MIRKNDTEVSTQLGGEKAQTAKLHTSMQKPCRQKHLNVNRLCRQIAIYNKRSKTSKKESRSSVLFYRVLPKEVPAQKKCKNESNKKKK